MKIIDKITCYISGLNFGKKLLRSYKYSKLNNDIERLSNIKKEIFELNLEINQNHYSSHIFGCGKSNAEIILRQYICNLGDFYRINKFILLGNAFKNTRLIFAIPPQWINYLRANRFRINGLLSTFFWNIIVLCYFGKGIYTLIKITINSLKKNKIISNKLFIHFLNLQNSNIPSQIKKESYDLISTYVNNVRIKKQAKLIYHSVKNNNLDISIDEVKIYYKKNYLPQIPIKNLIKFINWCVIALTICIIDFFRGRWWHALLISEAIYASQIRYAEKDELACEYIFNNSDWLYKPLWTYEAELKNLIVSLLFYSTNYEEPLVKGRKHGIPAGLKLMTWNNYYIWDDYQYLYLKKVIQSNNINFCKIGYSGLSDNRVEISFKDIKNLISVFDISPHKFINYCTYLDSSNLLKYQNAISFIRDVYSVCDSLDITMAWKTKRNLDEINHKGYKFLHNHFIKNKLNLKIIDFEVSAVKLIRESRGVISRPYTSTALIAKYMNIPSVYYDPTGLLHVEDPAAHGIRIIQSIDDLYIWISSIIR